MKLATHSFDNSDPCHQPPGRRRKDAEPRLASHLAVLCAVFLAASVYAQQADTAAEPTAPKAPQQTNAPAINVEEPDANKESKTDDWEWDSDWESKAHQGVRREAVVAIWHDAELKAEDRSEAVVAIGGSSRAL